MHFLYSSDREREMQLLKQRRLKHILSYNQYEMERKRKQRQDQYQSVKQNSRIINEEALHSLIAENHKREHKYIEQRNMLKETYEKQMKEREEKMKLEKIMDQQYYERQKEHMDYEQSRRMMELERLYNRATYEAFPYESYNHRRIKTEIQDPHETNRIRQSISRTPMARQGRQPHSLDLKPVPQSEGPTRDWQAHEGDQKLVRDSLDDLNAQQIRYPRNGQSMKNVMA